MKTCLLLQNGSPHYTSPYCGEGSGSNNGHNHRMEEHNGELRSAGVALRARNLKVCYGSTTALEISELAVHGHGIAVIGPNGSGKSTLMKTILGLLTPRWGEINAYSHNAGSLAQLTPELHMSFSPETGAVFGDLKVESYLKLWCRLKRGDSFFFQHEPSDIIGRLGVNSLLQRYGRELSKGERRRVQIAVGFLAGPKLFLFDEPFDGLDAVQSAYLLELLRHEGKQMGIIISSHRMEIVEQFADTIIVLNRGKIVAVGSLDEVCSHLLPNPSTPPNGRSRLDEVVTKLFA